MKHEKPNLPAGCRIKWIKSDRFERKWNFTLSGPAKAIFPLLCPVLEYAWLPGWKCAMAHSRSGVAEKDNVFLTRENPGRKAVWTCITYEPDSFIEYLITSGADAVIRLSIRLKETSRDRTGVDWRMLFTAFSIPGRAALRRRFTEAAFEEMMRARERELNWYLAHGTMIGRD